MSVSSARIKPLQTTSSSAAPVKAVSPAGPSLDPGRLVSAAERYQRQIWGVIGLIAIALVASVGVYFNNQRKLAADNVALARAFALLEARIDEEQSAAKKLNSSTPEGQGGGAKDVDDAVEPTDETSLQPHFATRRERDEAAHEAFVAAIPHLSSRSLATLAEMMAGNLEVELERPEEARKRFEGLVSRLAPGETLAALARMRLAYVLEGVDARKEALEILTPLTDEQRSHFADEASLMRARLLAAEGDVQLARITLEQVRTRSTNQALAEEARIALTALNDAGQVQSDAGTTDGAVRGGKPAASDATLEAHAP